MKIVKHHFSKGLEKKYSIQKNAIDYYPFGMLLPNRHEDAGEYRYGFNGMEKDDEIKGEGNSYDFGARIYDPRVGRWLVRDPLASKYPSVSPYNSFSNNPIINVDPDGRADIYFGGKWIGTDGVDDGLIVIATNTKIKNEVLEQTKQGNYYTNIGLSNGEKNDNFKAIHIDILEESVKVSKLGFQTKGTSREHTAVMNKSENGYTTIERRSPEEKTFKTSDGEVRADGGALASGDISIHSHPIGWHYNSNGEIVYHDARKPTKYDPATNSGDENAFKNYELNIIVGKAGFNFEFDVSTGITTDLRKNTIEVYDSKSNPIMSILYTVANSIVNDEKGKNKKAKSKFEKKRAKNKAKENK